MMFKIFLEKEFKILIYNKKVKKFYLKNYMMMIYKSEI